METTKGHPNSQQVDSTRGAWAVDRPGRPSPFGVQWREKIFDEKTGRELIQRRTEFFAKKDDRDKRLAEVLDNKRNGRTSGMSREDQRQWGAFMTAAKGVPWQEILSGYHQHLRATGARPCTETIASWGTKYLAAAAAEMKRGDLSEESERHKRRAIRELTTRIGHLPLDGVTAEQVEGLIDSLGFGSAATFNGYRKLYFAFFNRATALKVIRENPIAGLKRRRHVTDNRRFVLSPQNTAKLFAFAMTHDRFKVVVGRLALEAFLGVRFASSYRCSKEDLNVEDRTVLLPAKKLKTGKESGVGHLVDTRIYPGLSPLWEWLKIAPEAGWTLTPRQYMEMKSQVFIAAGVPHPKNCLRKSFATFDLAAHGNPGRTAYLLGHVDQEELWNDYKGNATSSAGRLYQQISPSTCRGIAEGARPPSPSPRRKAKAPRGESSSVAAPAHAVAAGG